MGKEAERESDFVLIDQQPNSAGMPSPPRGPATGAGVWDLQQKGVKIVT